jgi:hypothetical protein
VAPVWQVGAMDAPGQELSFDSRVSRSDISVANASSAAIAAHLAVKKIKQRVEQIEQVYLICTCTAPKQCRFQF